MGTTRRISRLVARILGAVALIMGWSAPALPQSPIAPSDTAPAARADFPADRVQQTVIARIPVGAEVPWADATTEHAIWVEDIGQKKSVHLDGKQIGELYDDVAYVRLSPDELHVAFTAKLDSKWYLVVDGRVATRGYGRLTSPDLSADAAPIAVGACNGKRCRVVVDTTEFGPEFEDISAPRLTRDRTHQVYFGKRGGKWVMVMDGAERGSPMDDFTRWLSSPDGARIAVAARFDKKWTWVVDTVPGPAFDVIGWLEFSPDSKHFAYGGTDAAASGFLNLGKHKTHGALVVDGSPARQIEGSGFGGGFSEALVARSSIVPGLHILTPAFYGLSDPTYAPDGSLILGVRRGDSDVVVLRDSVAGPRYEDLASVIVVTADGKHLFYVGRTGDLFTPVRDDQPGASFLESRAVSHVGRLALSTDGSHTAFELVRGGDGYKTGRTSRALRRLIIDGRSGPEYDALGIRDIWFSSDGKHHAYIVVGAEGDRDRVVFDGREGPLYDWVFQGSLHAIDDQHIEFIAKDGLRFMRVVETLE